MQPPESAKFSPAPFHAEVKGIYEALPSASLVAFVVTDGSGHADGFAGSSATVLLPGKLPIHIVSAATHSSTERGEFEGLLRGLQAVHAELKLTKGQLEVLKYAEPAQRKQVGWLTDRESLALAVARSSKTGMPFYSRRSTPDLWAMFEYFEQFYTVHALFSERCSTKSMELVDQLASDARQTLKNFYLSTFPPSDE